MLSPCPRRRARRRTDRGAVAIEFALLLPVMLLILGGIIDFGRAFFTQITVTNAAREGARAAIGSSATAGDVQTRATAAAPGLPGLTTSAVLCGSPGSAAQVTATTPFTWPVLDPLIPGNTFPDTLSSTAVMRCS